MALTGLRSSYCSTLQSCVEYSVHSIILKLEIREQSLDFVSDEKFGVDR